ncbi:hypothetical protein LCGC14_2685790 [marine sediment metagenome]|uniref:Uncharacterized protein n=1 Tax=marine sediment metagenome TaxID=412755 RepID=A0A0F8ZK03_9ZZZZ
MPDFSLIAGGNRIEEAGAVTADSGGTGITSNASANTKGLYTQLIASTAFQATAIMVQHGASATGASFLIDISIGAADSEQVIISNLFRLAKNDYMLAPIFPISTPAGSRIAARCQDDIGSGTLDLSISLFGNTLLNSASLSRVTAYGATTATSLGTAVTPGSNTEGAYAELSGSTTNPTRALLVVCAASDIALPNAQGLIDIAVGAATSEQVILSNLRYELMSSLDTLVPQCWGPFPVNIPAGIRIAARAAASGAQDLSAVVYGMD